MKDSLQTHRLVDHGPEHRPASDGHGMSPFEAAFHIPGNSRLRLDLQQSREQAMHYLEHAVSTSPEDLKSHVQRIFVALDRKDAAAVFGALMDLFIVLKRNGRSLRERLLTSAKPILDSVQYGFLHDRLETGVCENESLPPCGSCLLSKGIRGRHRLVLKHASPTPEIQDPLQEAREYLEYGQLEEARQVLESAILAQPLRLDLHRDLLEIYRRSQAREAFLTMQRRLNIQTHPLADAWHAVADFFEQR